MEDRLQRLSVGSVGAFLWTIVGLLVRCNAHSNYGKCIGYRGRSQ